MSNYLTIPQLLAFPPGSVLSLPNSFLREILGEISILVFSRASHIRITAEKGATHTTITFLPTLSFVPDSEL